MKLTNEILTSGVILKGLARMQVRWNFGCWVLY